METGLYIIRKLDDIWYILISCIVWVIFGWTYQTSPKGAMSLLSPKQDKPDASCQYQIWIPVLYLPSMLNAWSNWINTQIIYFSYNVLINLLPHTTIHLYISVIQCICMSRKQFNFSLEISCLCLCWSYDR